MFMNRLIFKNAIHVRSLHRGCADIDMPGCRSFFSNTAQLVRRLCTEITSLAARDAATAAVMASTGPEDAPRAPLGLSTVPRVR
jgi:hypothetical protein